LTTRNDAVCFLLPSLYISLGKKICPADLSAAAAFLSGVRLVGQNQKVPDDDPKQRGRKDMEVIDRLFSGLDQVEEDFASGLLLAYSGQISGESEGVF
jgi:hypothetical protein